MAMTYAIAVAVQHFDVPFIVSLIACLCHVESMYPPRHSVTAGVLWNTAVGHPVRWSMRGNIMIMLVGSAPKGRVIISYHTQLTK